MNTVEEVPVNVTTDITFDSSHSFEMVKTQIEEVIETYLSELRKTWGDGEYSTVRASQIDARILDIVGVVDIQNTHVNGVKNLALSEHQIPIIGSVINNA